MPLRLIIASLFVSASLALADTDAELFQKIIGNWSERNHDVTYLANGEWRLGKNGVPAESVCRWWIKDGYLIEFRDNVTYPPERVVWVSPNEFYLMDEQGAHSAS
jgi:hypothetical protein